MDCLEFRRILAAIPRSNNPDFVTHRHQCAACATASEHAQQFENEHEQALHVPTPEGLAERILLAQTTGHRQRFARGRRVALSLAASVLITLIVLGITGVNNRPLNAHSLPMLAIAHMPLEISTLDLTQPLSTQVVTAGFAGRNLTLHGPVPAGTTYVHDCMIGPYKAVHLITRRDGEPVVVLYMPDKPTSAARNFQRNGWVGREMPLGNGSLILLTNRNDRAPFEAVASDWRNAITGPETVQKNHASTAEVDRHRITTLAP